MARGVSWGEDHRAIDGDMAFWHQAQPLVIKLLSLLAAGCKCICHEVLQCVA